MKLLVIGTGSWGSALAKTASETVEVLALGRDTAIIKEINEQNTNTKYCGNIKLNYKATTSLEEAKKFSKVILMAIPMKVLKSYAQEMKEKGLTPEVIISVAKGFDVNTHQTPSQILQTVWPDAKVVVLTGPSHAESLITGAFTAAMIASESSEALEQTQEIFGSQILKLYPTKDIVGAELYGAAKNVYSIGAGAIDALGFKDNTKAAYITRVINELYLLGQTFDVDIETVFSLAGLGDLLVTSYSSNSRNYNYGKWLVTNKDEDKPLQTVEGVNTVKTLWSMAETRKVKMPILKQISKVIKKEISVQEATQILMMGKGNE